MNVALAAVDHFFRFEASTGLQRMLVEIPLTDDERAAVENDQNAVARLIDLLADSRLPPDRHRAN